MMMDPFLARNIVYGIEDSLISSTGVIVGVSLAGFPRTQVLTTGIILIIVEALSMAFGSFVSEDSFMSKANILHTNLSIMKYAVAMLLSYVLAGAIPLIPFALDVPNAWIWSCGLALVSLFALLFTFQKKTLPRKKKTQHSMVLTSIGAVILAISVVSGKYLQ
jgi:VIT1/CCC1 family predicted Fe2+/Mn2+ transporter